MMIPAQNQPALSVCPFEIFSKMSGMFCELVRALILSSYLPVPTGTLETRSRPGELIYRDYGFTIFTPARTVPSQVKVIFLFQADASEVSRMKGAGI